MTADELTAVLHRDIPIAQAMGVSVTQAEPCSVLLTAPLAPNINHMGTLFGGSATTLATLAAWSLLYLRLSKQHPPSDIIIQHGRMDYRRPIAGKVTARCEFDDLPLWHRFVRTLDRHGRARLTLHADVLGDGRAGAVFDGDFVALHYPSHKLIPR